MLPRCALVRPRPGVHPHEAHQTVHPQRPRVHIPNALVCRPSLTTWTQLSRRCVRSCARLAPGTDAGRRSRSVTPPRGRACTTTADSRPGMVTARTAAPGVRNAWKREASAHRRPSRDARSASGGRPRTGRRKGWGVGGRGGAGVVLGGVWWLQALETLRTGVGRGTTSHVARQRVAARVQRIQYVGAATVRRETAVCVDVLTTTAPCSCAPRRRRSRASVSSVRREPSQMSSTPGARMRTRV